MFHRTHHHDHGNRQETDHEHCEQHAQHDGCCGRHDGSCGHHHDQHHAGQHPQARLLKDPVCGMSVTAEGAAERREAGDETFLFCSSGCAAAFDADPARYTAAHHAHH